MVGEGGERDEEAGDAVEVAAVCVRAGYQLLTGWPRRGAHVTLRAEHMISTPLLLRIETFDTTEGHERANGFVLI